jgi:hypothetical protein
MTIYPEGPKKNGRKGKKEGRPRGSGIAHQQPGGKNVQVFVKKKKDEPESI